MAQNPIDTDPPSDATPHCLGSLFEAVRIRHLETMERHGAVRAAYSPGGTLGSPLSQQSRLAGQVVCAFRRGVSAMKHCHPHSRSLQVETEAPLCPSWRPEAYSRRHRICPNLTCRAQLAPRGGLHLDALTHLTARGLTHRQRTLIGHPNTHFLTSCMRACFTFAAIPLPGASARHSQ